MPGSSSAHCGGTPTAITCEWTVSFSKRLCTTPWDANDLEITEAKSVVPDSSTNKNEPNGSPRWSKILSKSGMPVEVEGCDVIVDGRTVGFCLAGASLTFGTGGCLPATKVEPGLAGTVLAPGAPPRISPRFLKDMSKLSNLQQQALNARNARRCAMRDDLRERLQNA